MAPIGPRSHTYEVNAMLRVSSQSKKEIKDFFTETYNVKRNRINSDFHLTVNHARRNIPGLREGIRSVMITANISETRFMVLVPGGENPREGIDPRAHSVGIRLTRRNTAIPEIQDLRGQILQLEARVFLGRRNPTTAWTNSFGSRHYQPHIQLLRPWHKISDSLSEIGQLFRKRIGAIAFDSFQIEARHRVDGKWVAGRQRSLMDR